MDLKTSKECLVCTSCLVSLEGYLSFMRNCWNVEEKIDEYCAVKGCSEKKVDLNHVMNFVSRKIWDGTDRCTQIEVKKEELLLEEYDVIKVEVKVEENQTNIEEADKNVIHRDSIRFEDVPTSEAFASSSHLAPRKKTYQCELCPYIGKRGYNLKSHMLTHKDPSEVTMYNCDLCPYATKKKSDLTRHKISHKDRSEVQLHKCQLCPYEGKRKDLLNCHMKVHKDRSGVTRYKCEVCGYKTNRKSNFEFHKRTHKDPSEITMYKCDVCSYSSKLKGNLKSHSLIHKDPAEVTMYKCEVCVYQTKHKYMIKKHAKVHDKRLRYKS